MIARRHRNWVWLGYWFALFIATHTPMARGLIPGCQTDKIIHFVVYYFLTALSAWARTGVGRRSGRRDLAWAGVFLAYGAADEWLQSFVGRTMSLGDGRPSTFA